MAVLSMRGNRWRTVREKSEGRGSSPEREREESLGSLVSNLGSLVADLGSLMPERVVERKNGTGRKARRSTSSKYTTWIPAMQMKMYMESYVDSNESSFPLR